MRRALFFVALVACTGCALVAGLRDRDPFDDAGVPSDATIETGGGDTASDSPADGTPPDAATDSPVPSDARADSPADSSDGATCAPRPPGFITCAGDAACADGCCVEAGTCASIVACPGNHLTCDGPEDCAGMLCCAGSSTQVVVSVCTTSCGGTTMCHSDCECADASPICCPYPGAPDYARCAPTCP